MSLGDSWSDNLLEVFITGWRWEYLHEVSVTDWHFEIICRKYSSLDNTYDCPPEVFITGQRTGSIYLQYLSLR